MRSMLPMIPRGDESAAPGTRPDDAGRVGAPMARDQAMHDGGVLPARDGSLHPPSRGARMAGRRAP